MYISLKWYYLLSYSVVAESFEDGPEGTQLPSLTIDAIRSSKSKVKEMHLGGVHVITNVHAASKCKRLQKLLNSTVMQK